MKYLCHWVLGLWVIIFFCGTLKASPFWAKDWTKSKIFILHEPHYKARNAAKEVSKMIKAKSKVPRIFMAERETKSCRYLEKSLRNVDWYLVLCVDKKIRLNLLRFRREQFYSMFSPYWSKN